MKKIFILLQKNLDTHLVSAGTVISVLSFVFKATSLIKDIALTKINVSIVLIILFFVLRKIFNEIPKAKKESFGINRNVHSDRAIKFAKIGTYAVWIFILIPLFFLTTGILDYFTTKNLEKQACNKKLIGLMIANFSQSKDDDVDFSSNLYQTLDARLQNTDSINLIQLNKYIPEGLHYKDTIREEFNNNCSDTGLLVFGRRKDSQLNSSKLFYCRISSLNFFNKRTNVFETNNKTIIYIKNPNDLEFSIDYQSNAIAEFIFGLLYNRASNYMESNRAIDSAIALNKNKDNTAFLAYCHLFKGDNSLQHGNLTEAIKEYDTGIQIDSSNAFLHYNKAAVYKQMGNTQVARNEYTIAHSLNNSFTNPMGKGDSLNKKYTYNSTSKFLKKDSTNLVGKNMQIAINRDSILRWEETCFTVENKATRKWGVMNNKNDTIVKLIYDGLETLEYKDMDCYIVNYRGKYGAIIHKHVNAAKPGYLIYTIDPLYSMYKAKELSENWVDNNQHIRVDN